MLHKNRSKFLSQNFLGLTSCAQKIVCKFFFSLCKYLQSYMQKEIIENLVIPLAIAHYLIIWRML